MATRESAMMAQQVLAERLLRAGERGRVLARSRSRTIAAALASAGSNVHAVGVGRKVVDGKATSEVCVRIHVVEKLAPSALPEMDRLPEAVDGVPTDVIESPPAFIYAGAPVAAPACTMNRRERQRPIRAGISAGHFNITAGTIGYFCRSTRAGDNGGDVFLLSNNHVFADVNAAAAGDDILQPGKADGGLAGDAIADLQRFVPIELGAGSRNRVDAATCRLRPAVARAVEICQVGAITGSQRATDGLFVRKHGRTTGYTEGEVTDEPYTAIVGMDHNDPNIFAEFQDQMRIEVRAPFTAIGLGGDSGSLVVQRTQPLALGLYFAGPQSGSYGIANHIHNVAAELEIALL